MKKIFLVSFKLLACKGPRLKDKLRRSHHMKYEDGSWVGRPAAGCWWRALRSRYWLRTAAGRHRISRDRTARNWRAPRFRRSESGAAQQPRAQDCGGRNRVNHNRKASPVQPRHLSKVSCDKSIVHLRFIHMGRFPQDRIYTFECHQLPTSRWYSDTILS